MIKMHAKKLKSDTVYRCPGCDCYYDADTLYEIEVIVINNDDASRDNNGNYFSESWHHENRWRCQDSCDLEEEPDTISELWQCGRCEYKYYTAEEAADCCL